jgi:hypothetical protein
MTNSTMARCKQTICAVLMGTIVLHPFAALAAQHPLSSVTTNSQTLQTLDLATNVDWDFDASPAVTNGSGVALNRDFITAAYTQMAKSLHMMTEGRHRIGTVYVYKNSRYGSAVDVKLSKDNGLANATVGGWGTREGTMSVYAGAASSSAGSDAAKLAVEVGQSMAYVSAMYVYGLMAEYRALGLFGRPTDASNPQENDTSLNTIMGDQSRFTTLSTPGDIVATTQTVQRRIYGASAWETLARPTSADPAQAAVFGRTAFAAFSGFVPKDAAALTRPQTGWEGLKVVFMESPREISVFVLSRGLNNQAFASSKQAIVQSMRQITPSASTFASVVAYGGNAAGQTVVPLNAISTEEARDAVIASVEAITTDSVTTSLDVAFVAALDSIDRQYKSGALSRGDAITVNIFPREQDDVSVANRQRSKALGVAVNASLLVTDLNAPVAMMSSTVTGPSSSGDHAKYIGIHLDVYRLVDWILNLIIKPRRGAAMTAGAVKSRAASLGQTVVTLAEDHAERVVAGTPFVLKTPVLAKTDGALTFTADWESSDDSAKVRFELTAPDGTKFAPTNPLANQSFGSNGYVKYVMNADAASAHFEVDRNYVGKNGLWSSALGASSTINSSVELYAEADSLLRAVVAVRGNGTSRPVITVTAGSDRALQGALATAYVFDGTGALKLTQVLKDDGTAGDAQPDDGVYSASIAGKLPAGTYDVVVDVTQGASGAQLATGANTVPSTQRPAAEPLGGAFSRSAETLMTVAPTTVVEYFVPALKKYFITGRDTEKAALAQYPDIYRPTGMTFVAGPGLAPPEGTQPICRFYFSPPLANTHFYGAPADCALVASAFAGNAAVTNEGIDFAIALPDATGNCPASAPQRITRSFNNRTAQNDGNHRYTVSLVRYSQMSLLGWASEGTVFCAASATDATSAPE